MAEDRLTARKTLVDGPGMTTPYREVFRFAQQHGLDRVKLWRAIARQTGWERQQQIAEDSDKLKQLRTMLIAWQSNTLVSGWSICKL